MNAVIETPTRMPLVARFAQRFGIEPARMLETLKATCFKSEKPISNEAMMGLLIVSEQYNLNPFTRELFAFLDKNGGIVPFVSVDGWARIINEHAQFDGMDFAFAEDGGSCTCTMYRKDRSHPIRITEYLAECKRGTAPWGTHPRRMLRHKAMIQCARIAFGFAGLYDEDEARRIVHMGPADLAEANEPAPAGPAKLDELIAKGRKSKGAATPKPASEPADVAQADAPLSPPAQTLAQFIEAIERAPEAEEAALVIDRAHSMLAPEDYAQAQAVYRKRWTE
jgi:hypothetical protein